MNNNLLLDVCTGVKIEPTDDEIRIIEEDTRKQAKKEYFFSRVGASISKEASHSNPAQRSISLIKTICYSLK